MLKSYSSKLYSVILVLGLALVACTSDEPTIDKIDDLDAVIENPKEDSIDENFVDPYNNILYRRCMNFDYDFLKAAISSTEGNVVVSPFSAQVMMGILGLSSTPEIQSNICETYKWNNMTELWNFHSQLLTDFSIVDSRVATDLATSLWHDASNIVSQTFSNVFLELYGGGVNSCDFSSAAALQQIDDWCSNHTRTLVENAFSSIDDSELLLISSSYFNAPWGQSIKIDHTIPHSTGSFTGTSGERQVEWTKLIGNVGRFDADDDSYIGFRIELGNGSFAATFILPDYGVKISDVINTLDYKSLITQKIIWKPTIPRIYIPQMGTIRSTSDVNAIFSQMGLDVLLADSMSEIGVDGIEKVILSQNSSVEFSEQGVISASASVSSGIVPNDYIDFTPADPIEFNRPYLFFINHMQSGACIIAGAIENI